MQPAASTVKLLRVLEADPTVLSHLLGDKHPRLPARHPYPFDVSGKHNSLVEHRRFPRITAAPTSRRSSGT